MSGYGSRITRTKPQLTDGWIAEEASENLSWTVHRSVASWPFWIAFGVIDFGMTWMKQRSPQSIYNEVTGQEWIPSWMKGAALDGVKDTIEFGLWNGFGRSAPFFSNEPAAPARS